MSDAEEIARSVDAAELRAKLMKVVQKLDNAHPGLATWTDHFVRDLEEARRILLDALALGIKNLPEGSKDLPR